MGCVVRRPEQQFNTRKGPGLGVEEHQSLRERCKREEIHTEEKQKGKSTAGIEQTYMPHAQIPLRHLALGNLS